MVFWVILACCLLLLILTGVLMRRWLLVVTVDSGSMMPTLQPGERVLVLRRWPGMQLRKDQIVVFWLSLSDAQLSASHRRPYIKRIVGLGGETLTETVLNSAEQEQQRNQKDPRQERQWHIPANHIFVCGDHRDASTDSRTWGAVPEQNVLGVVAMKLPRRAYAPPSSPIALQSLPSAGLPPGHQAPPFTARTLTGKPVTLAAYRGQPVLFLFFAPAEHCRNAIALCSMLAPRLAEKGVTIVCVSSAMQRSTRLFTKEIQMRLPVLVAPRSQNSLFSDYNIEATPAFCLLDEQGKVQSTGRLSMQEEAWKTLFEAWTKSAGGASKEPESEDSWRSGA